MITTPILQSLNSFDATKEQKFPFFVNSGDQTVKVRLIVRDNSNNSVVYDDINITFNHFYTLPLNSLTNGLTYNAQLSTFNIADDESELSNTILFTCLTTPTIEITNLTSGIVNNSSYEFTGSYTSVENEPLDSYIFYLYNSNDELISTSDIKYDELLKHTFYSFEDNYEYGIELKIKTLHGMEVSTGIIPFSIDYIRPNMPSALTIENVSQNGYIKISGSLIAIEAVQDASEYTFIDDEYIDLSSGNNVLFNEGFDINGNFTLKIWGKDLINRTTFFTMGSKTDSTKELKLVYFDHKIEVYQTNGSLTYYTFSNTISEPLATDLLCVWLRRINGLIDISLTNTSVV